MPNFDRWRLSRSKKYTQHFLIMTKALPNYFDVNVQNELISRINQITIDSKPLWGKMSAAQMLAHLNVMFELGLEQKHKRPNAMIRFMLQKFVKESIINEVPYKKNSRTAPEMIIKTHPELNLQKNEVLNYIKKTGKLGSHYFEQRQHPSFGNLSSKHWSNLFYKHIDHHLRQFGV